MLGLPRKSQPIVLIAVVMIAGSTAGTKAYDGHSNHAGIRSDMAAISNAARLSLSNLSRRQFAQNGWGGFNMESTDQMNQNAIASQQRICVNNCKISYRFCYQGARTQAQINSCIQNMNYCMNGC